MRWPPWECEVSALNIYRRRAGWSGRHQRIPEWEGEITNRKTAIAWINIPDAICIGASDGAPRKRARGRQTD